jgi:hypothetical protein
MSQAMEKIIFILLMTFASFVLFSCSPKSFCFFNPRENKLFISNDTCRIRSITIIKLNDVTIYKELDSPQKEYFLSGDTVVNKAIRILVTTTDFRDSYMLKLSEEDWRKDKVFTFRYLIR